MHVVEREKKRRRKKTKKTSQKKWGRHVGDNSGDRYALMFGFSITNVGTLQTSMSNLPYFDVRFFSEKQKILGNVEKVHI